MLDEGRPSTTAQRVAVRRAAHQLLDHPRVFDDPLALPILGAAAASALAANPLQFEATRLSRYLRAFLAVRSRYAEDELSLAIQRGISQYVVLGAGLDTFAYRNAHPAGGLRVFEVDHPATQTWKRGRLGEAGIAIPESLTFVPLDFERQTLADGLATAGFNRDAPSFFSWLGVTPYLTMDAIEATLGFIATTAPPGSGVVFDYGVSPSLLGPAQRFAIDAMSRRVAEAGEPWRTFFEPPALESRLRRLGFSSILDLGADEINGRYFSGRTDGLQVGGAGRLMRAVV